VFCHSTAGKYYIGKKKFEQTEQSRNSFEESKKIKKKTFAEK
jgi:hypothetical protein